MAQQLPNPLTMAAALQRSSQALKDAAVAHKSLSVEFALLPNAPAMQEQEIMAILTTMNQQMQTIDQQLRAIDQRIQAMDLHSQAHFYNVSCMLSNGRVKRPDMPLRPLRNTTNNQPIPNFPQNLNMVDGIECCETFRALLNALGEQLNPQWTLMEARQCFRKAIGCSLISYE
ncbi:hypothetical protein BGZ60DRAFT_435502 [Tricladium varicosporioides]|nr:hypothetical protein BGZ60DRAFT_435502 [Hymenoscyphus varicosporioides]